MTEETPKRILLPISFFQTKDDKPKNETIYMKRGEKVEKIVKTPTGSRKKSKKEEEPNQDLDMLLAKDKPTKKDVIEYFKKYC